MYGVNKPLVLLKQRKYYLLRKGFVREKKENPNTPTERIRQQTHAHFSQNLMSSSQYFVRTSSRRFPTRSDSTDDFLSAAAESGLSPSRGTSPSNTHRRQVAYRLHDQALLQIKCMLFTNLKISKTSNYSDFDLEILHYLPRERFPMFPMILPEYIVDHYHVLNIYLKNGKAIVD